MRYASAASACLVEPATTTAQVQALSTRRPSPPLMYPCSGERITCLGRALQPVVEAKEELSAQARARPGHGLNVRVGMQIISSSPRRVKELSSFF